MSLEFRLSNSIDMAGVQLAVAAYVFSSDMMGSEVLVDADMCRCDKTTLRSLLPKAKVLDDVSPSHAHHHDSSHCTSLQVVHAHESTTIMQAVVEGCHLSAGTLARIRHVYMRSLVDEVQRLAGHWYLMIIDVPRKKLVYLDSLQNGNELEKQKEYMEKVALELESTTVEQNWLSGPGKKRPRFSTFEFEFPACPQQEPESMDCGICVTQWMVREAMFAHCRVESVGPKTRIKLAVDLVLKPHNALAKDVVIKALAH
ncbi:hypothetical protein PIB30_059765 [Stylosanthes scabra]|uniref:Ubiquitin-like protease family profile domain-containing protein n=1 Tax=Stylosanthes scabra TaxID=79078 RepID=A0ABU6QKY5_9FABA|nr:hypothetical protein [Stylosanthes scabra]